MAQNATYELVIKLNKAIGFLIEEYGLQLSDIARAVPVNLGNLSGYLRLRPEDKLPKRKTLEKHYQNLKVAFSSELRLLSQQELRSGQEFSYETRGVEELPDEYGLRNEGEFFGKRGGQGLAPGERGLAPGEQGPPLEQRVLSIESAMREMTEKMVEMEGLLRRLLERGGKEDAGS